MKKGYLIVVIVLIASSLPSLVALTLRGDQLSPIYFEPGKEVTNHYSISDTSKKVEVNLGGDLQEYISLTPAVNGEFDMIIQFPDELIPAGSYSFSLHVREISDSNNAGFESLLAVTRQFTVIVYSHEKEISVSVAAPSVNEGTPVNFQVSVGSLGFQNISSVRALLKVISESNQTLATLTTEERPLPALSSTTFTVPFETGGLSAGNYRVDATVFYDGKQKEAHAAFKIGDLDLILKEYSSVLLPGFTEFNATVMNNWGSEMRNVYLKLTIEGEELLHTPTVTLAPWQEHTFNGIIKLDRPPGTYTGKMDLFFEGEHKEETVTITVVLPPEEVKTGMSMATIITVSGILILGLLATVLTLLLQRRKIHHNTKDEI